MKHSAGKRKPEKKSILPVILIVVSAVTVVYISLLLAMPALMNRLPAGTPEADRAPTTALPTSAVTAPTEPAEPASTTQPSPAVSPVRTPPPEREPDPDKNEGPDDRPGDTAVLFDLLDACFDNNNPGGNWAVYVYDLPGNKGLKYVFGDEEPKIAASLIKLFIAGAVFDAEKDGSLTLTSDDMYDLEIMIKDSDNPSANRLTRRLGNGDSAAGMRAVCEWASGIGCPETQLNRELGADNPTTENYTTVSDCATLLRMIADGQFADARCSELMLTWMGAESVNPNKSAKIREGIRGAGYTVRNKTGELISPISVENDVAIAETLSGNFVLCVMSADSAPGKARSLTAQIAETACLWFEGAAKEAR